MNRRDFIKGCAVGFASVAIGMKMAQGMPEVLADGYEYKTYGTGFSEVGERYTRALAVSMRKTKEIVARNVLERAFNPEHHERLEQWFKDHPETSGEGARRAAGVGGSPGRVL